MTTDTAEPPDKVGRAGSLFEAGEWHALADLAVAETFDGDDVAALAAVHGGEDGAEHWEEWADSEGRAEALTAIGLILASLERDADAVGVLVDAHRRGENVAAMIGELYVYLRDWASAEPWLQLAVDTTAHTWELAAYRLGEHAFEVDDRFDDQVISLLEAGSVEADEAAVVLARVHLRRGDRDEARRILEEALPDNEMVSLPLGNMLLNEFGDTDGARAAYEDGWNRGDAYSAFNLGLLLEEELDQPEEAREWMRKAAQGGDAAARAWLTADGEGGWAESRAEAGDSPAWMHALYDEDLLPHLYGGPYRGPDLPTVFRINDVVGAPAPGVVGRAGRLGLPIVIEPHAEGFDLTTLGTAITQIRDLTIADAAGTRGWGALAGALALEELEMDGTEPGEPVDLGALPCLENASVRGRNTYSVVANPALRILSMTLLDDQPAPGIEAPIESFGVSGRRAVEAVGRIAHPESLTGLVIVGAVDVDCALLLRFPALEDVSLVSCTGVSNTHVLGELPLLAALAVDDCRDVEDAEEVAALVQRLESQQTGPDDGR
ncbi:tetratricopeptide repeat protein [Labedella endophytica]|uniref:Tetratricopeptide repeat protein n=1 Tax=Labedella endophytica TaxID=1523160 RepID=A0A3S0VGH6_9MICO|nr:tetratricopeptide repeat protein [Labedella endophytica]RUR01267.1 tetratricopeptide repeat protein [Labedella endophytica]